MAQCLRFSRNVEVSGKEQFCRAYQNFNGQMKTLQTTYKLLNPVQSRRYVRGDKYDLDSSGMVMLQGALINAEASWEEFIVEIFKEGFALQTSTH